MENIQKSDFLSNVELITKEENLGDEEKKKLIDLVNKAIEKSNSPLDSDPWIYRMVVLFLGLSVIGCVVFGFLIALWKNDMETPQILIALGSAAVGALAGLLAPSPKNK